MKQVAILLLGHGSRAREANDGMFKVLDALRSHGQYRIVEVGFMGLNPPTIDEGAAACVAQGAQVVLMIPYFLHTGIHIQQDIPEVMQRLRAMNPDVQFALGEPLGFHPKLVDIVLDRIDQCRETVDGAGVSPTEIASDEHETGATGRSQRTGYSTGACAAAAAKAAARALLAQELVAQVELTLPAGQLACFSVARCEVEQNRARCAIVKDGGDDPDVTHGADIEATVTWQTAPGITLKGGTGVGVITKPGLELPVGEPAINPVPRQMIRGAVGDVLDLARGQRGVTIEISVPRGEEIAQKTLNRRLGIVGGISILGTTGIVVPFSTAAYKSSIAQALAVAVATGCQEVVLTTGRRSERFAQAIVDLPEEAYVQMGDFVGFALEQCAQRGITRVVICAMIGKLSKLAAGHFQTHVNNSSVAPSFLAGVAAECGASTTLVREIAEANTGRHFGEIIRENGLTAVFQRLSLLAAERCAAHVGGKLRLTCILTDFDGAVLGRASVE